MESVIKACKELATNAPEQRGESKRRSKNQEDEFAKGQKKHADQAKRLEPILEILKQALKFHAVGRNDGQPLDFELGNQDKNGSGFTGDMGLDPAGSQAGGSSLGHAQEPVSLDLEDPDPFNFKAGSIYGVGPDNKLRIIDPSPFSPGNPGPMERTLSGSLGRKESTQMVSIRDGIGIREVPPPEPARRTAWNTYRGRHHPQSFPKLAPKPPVNSGPGGDHQDSFTPTSTAPDKSSILHGGSKGSFQSNAAPGPAPTTNLERSPPASHQPESSMQLQYTRISVDSMLGKPDRDNAAASTDSQGGITSSALIGDSPVGSQVSSQTGPHGTTTTTG